LMVDMFVGGAETTTHSRSNGMKVLIENPDVLAKLKADPERYVERFVEEALRLESPVQGQMRMVDQDVELHGVSIAAGSTVLLRYAAGNRDERYGQADEIDLERKNPRGHLAFSVGKHHCIGAPLARRELSATWKTVVERLHDVRFAEGKNDFSFQPNYFLRGLNDLYLEFTPGPRVG
jgi:cytochrome P450